MFPKNCTDHFLRIIYLDVAAALVSQRETHRVRDTERERQRALWCSLRDALLMLKFDHSTAKFMSCRALVYV